MDSQSSESSFVNQGLFAGLLELLFPGLTYLPHFAVLLFLIKYIAESWGQVIITSFISTVEIRAHDETYNYVMSWVARNSLSRDNHRLIASSTITNEDFAWSDRTGAEDNGEFENSIDEGDSNPSDINDLRSKILLYNSRPLYWTPAMGLHFFLYERRIVAFTRSFEERGTSPFSRRAERLFISCFGRDARILKQLLTKARMEYLESEKGRINIYRGIKAWSEDEMTWARAIVRPTRPMSTIALDESIKQSFVQDLQRYLNPKTKTWYATRGIPYRRGYLFSGPPGTGKTSLTLAAAGLVGLDIYMINLNSPRLTEDSLAALFQNLPRTCLVLLEDIDATGVTHTRNLGRGNGDLKPLKSRNRERISLSALLNVIDGVAAQEGRVLVMTSNHTKEIDPALLRPGRIDFSIDFGLATSEIAAKIFMQMYDVQCSGPLPQQMTNDRGKGLDGLKTSETLVTDQVNSSVQSAGTIESLAPVALEFGEKIPASVFSPAAIQGFLLAHQDDPIGAIAAVDSWVQQQTLDKLKPNTTRLPEVSSGGSDEESSDDQVDDDQDKEIYRG